MKNKKQLTYKCLVRVTAAILFTCMLFSISGCNEKVFWRAVSLIPASDVFDVYQTNSDVAEGDEESPVVSSPKVHLYVDDSGSMKGYMAPGKTNLNKYFAVNGNNYRTILENLPYESNSGSKFQFTTKTTDEWSFITAAQCCNDLTLYSNKNSDIKESIEQMIENVNNEGDDLAHVLITDFIPTVDGSYNEKIEKTLKDAFFADSEHTVGIIGFRVNHHGVLRGMPSTDKNGMHITSIQPSNIINVNSDGVYIRPIYMLVMGDCNIVADFIAKMTNNVNEYFEDGDIESFMFDKVALQQTTPSLAKTTLSDTISWYADRDSYAYTVVNGKETALPDQENWNDYTVAKMKPQYFLYQDSTELDQSAEQDSNDAAPIPGNDGVVENANNDTVFSGNYYSDFCAKADKYWAKMPKSFRNFADEIPIYKLHDTILRDYINDDQSNYYVDLECNIPYNVYFPTDDGKDLMTYLCTQFSISVKVETINSEPRTFSGATYATVDSPEWNEYNLTDDNLKVVSCTYDADTNTATASIRLYIDFSEYPCEYKNSSVDAIPVLFKVSPTIKTAITNDSVIGIKELLEADADWMSDWNTEKFDAADMEEFDARKTPYLSKLFGNLAQGYAETIANEINTITADSNDEYVTYGLFGFLTVKNYVYYTNSKVSPSDSSGFAFSLNEYNYINQFVSAKRTGGVS